jgi:putative transposase
VWLDFRFCVSYRDGEELLLERGMAVTSEAMRTWCRPCGPRTLTTSVVGVPGSVTNSDSKEVLVTITGERQYLWRAVN